MQGEKRKFIISMIVKLSICLAIFGLMIFGFYFNSCDGVWNGTYVMAGDWELSLGRWAIRYLDMLHFGVAVHPMGSIVALLLFSIGTYFLSKTFEIEIGSFTDYLISFIFLGNVIVCVSLSYLYTSRTYGLAFAMACICFWLIARMAQVSETFQNKTKIIGYFVLGVLGIAVVLGLYQAYIGCLAELVLFYFVFLVCKGKSIREIVKYVITCATTAIAGGVAYYIILHIELFRYGVTLSSYKGADSFSIMNIVRNSLSSVVETYRITLRYFNGVVCRWNMFPNQVVWIVLALAVCVCVVLSYQKTKSIIRTLVSVLALCAFPMATNITTILIPNNEPSIQQTAPLALIIPCLIYLCMGLISIEKDNRRTMKTLFIILAVISLCMIHGSVYQSLVDQETMRQGTMAAKSFSQSIVDKLIADGIDPEENTFAFVGSPIYNSMVRANKIYSFSNGYARICGGYPGNYLDMCTWGGILSNINGVGMRLCDEDIYLKLLEDDEVKTMPNFPQEGSIINHSSGVWVIRISEW